MPSLVAAHASLKRIQAFLAMDEKPGDGDSLSPASEVIALDTLSANVTLERASFSWTPGKTLPLVLEDVDLVLQAGKLHMIIGPVASVG